MTLPLICMSFRRARSRPSSRGRHAFALLLRCGLSLGIATPAGAVWPDGVVVNETVHNLSRTATVFPMSTLFADYGDACVYCHSPHGGVEGRPLWNREAPTGPYRMYDSGSIDMIADPQPTGISLMCLSCHDGTMGLDEVVNHPNDYAGQPLGEPIETCATDCHNGGNPDGGFNWENVWLDPDKLRDHHPISILYDPSRDPDFNSVASVEAAGLRLFDGKVQCASCHDPHSQQFSPFLRVANSGSSICFVCHNSPPGESTAHFW